MVVLLVPVVVLLLLVRQQWGVLGGRWDFGGRMTTTMRGGKGEMGEGERGVNGTLGVS